MTKPEKILERALARATASGLKPLIKNRVAWEKLEFVCRCLRNRAGVRLLMACLLAKLDRPTADPRKPYTEIGTSDSFSGRYYDEAYITHFINQYRLPCNPTTAFLTPALRNIDQPLTKKFEIVGRPRELYIYTIEWRWCIKIDKR